MPLPAEATYSYTVAAPEFGCSESVLPKKRGSRKVLVFQEAPDVEPFVIDEDNYLVILEIYANTEFSMDELRRNVKTRKRDEEEEGRVYKLEIVLLHNLPPPQADAFYKLVAYLEPSYKIESIPPSIGSLQNLKELQFCCNDIPEEIGELTNLKKLVMSVESITSPASSIGRLQNLEELLLVFQGEHLPEEIGNLMSLKRFYLFGNNITYLPSSIGRLQNLKKLAITSSTNRLVNLPQEIGDLNNLRVLDPLVVSRIWTLPHSTLGWTLPHSILGKLKRLQHLNLDDYAHVPQLKNKKGLTKFLLTVVQECPVLGFIGNKTIERIEEGADQVNYKLACNRARWKLLIAGGLEETPKLWPLVLQNATRLFEEYSSNDLNNGDVVDDQDEEDEASIFSIVGEVASSYDRTNPYVIPMPDAVYRLIVGVDPVGRESFIKVLMNRNENNVSTVPSSLVKC